MSRSTVTSGGDAGQLLWSRKPGWDRQLLRGGPGWRTVMRAWSALDCRKPSRANYRLPSVSVN